MHKLHDNSALTAEELELLLLTARTSPGVAALARVAELVKYPIHWQRLFQIAGAHGVAGLAGANWLNIARSGLPGSVAIDIGRQLQATTMRGMFLSAQLVTILRAFASANICALSFKGPTLAMHAYQTFSTRPFGDVDVLVAPNDAARAAKLLNTLGFDGWTVAAKDEAHHLATECEETFVRTAGGGQVVVDLHWALSRGYLPLAIPFEDLWQRSITIPVAGMPIWTPGCEDLLLYLCLHGAKHGWERLIWICDIAELLNHERHIDWKSLFARAARTGSARCLRLGLLLASDLVDAPLPAEVDLLIRRDRVVVRLSQSIRSQFARAKAAEKSGLVAYLRASLFHLQVRDRLTDRMRYLLRAAVPNTRDRGLVALPRPLHFLYFVSRPLRLLGRHGLRRA